MVTVVFLLTSALGECKGFLETKRKDLRKSEDHWELFEGLNLYWNYLSFGLLHGLIDDLFERNKAFGEIKKEMEKYSQGIQQFRARTKLVLFCEVHYSMLAINPLLQPPGFRKMVTEHQWPETVTLKDVEEFRKRFLHTFGLQECAIMVHRIRGGDLLNMTFTENDVPEIVQNILTLKAKLKALGFILKIPKPRLDSIHQQHSNTQDCLLGVIDEFVKQVHPRPTWRVILSALRSPLIREYHLALKIERKFSLLPTTYQGKSVFL